MDYEGTRWKEVTTVEKLMTINVTIAQVLFSASYIPQVVRTIATRSANDFDWTFVAMLLTACTMQGAYFAHKKLGIPLAGMAVSAGFWAFIGVCKVIF